MSKVSVIIPSSNEIFLNKTVDDLFEKAEDEIEVIAILDNYWPVFEDENGEMVSLMPHDRDGLRFIHFGKQKGMRACINAGASIATGKYLMKVDAHCMFADGWDTALKNNCDGNWLAIPSRFSLRRTAWEVKDTGKARVDYHYLSFPEAKGRGIHGTVWNSRARERKDDPRYNIDDEMSFQGSCWFMHIDHFHRLGGMSEYGYGTFIQEPQELGLKVWLSGGRNVVNKTTWYAHMHKGSAIRRNGTVVQQGRGYGLSGRQAKIGNDYSAWFWLTDQPFEGRTRNIEWLLEKFWPVPGWDENWRDLIEERM